MRTCVKIYLTVCDGFCDIDNDSDNESTVVRIFREVLLYGDRWLHRSSYSFLLLLFSLLLSLQMVKALYWRLQFFAVYRIIKLIEYHRQMSKREVMSNKSHIARNTSFSHLLRSLLGTKDISGILFN